MTQGINSTGNVSMGIIANATDKLYANDHIFYALLFIPKMVIQILVVIFPDSATELFGDSDWHFIQGNATPHKARITKE